MSESTDANSLRDLIQAVGVEIQPKLLPLPGHSVRNAYAHIFGMVKHLCNASYSEADPVKVRAVVEAIRQDPNGDIQTILTSAKIIRRSLLETEQS